MMLSHRDRHVDRALRKVRDSKAGESLQPFMTGHTTMRFMSSLVPDLVNYVPVFFTGIIHHVSERKPLSFRTYRYRCFTESERPTVDDAGEYARITVDRVIKYTGCTFDQLKKDPALYLGKALLMSHEMEEKEGARVRYSILNLWAIYFAPKNGAFLVLPTADINDRELIALNNPMKA